MIESVPLDMAFCSRRFQIVQQQVKKERIVNDRISESMNSQKSRFKLLELESTINNAIMRRWKEMSKIIYVHASIKAAENKKMGNYVQAWSKES